MSELALRSTTGEDFVEVDPDQKIAAMRVDGGEEEVKAATRPAAPVTDHSTWFGGRQPIPTMTRGTGRETHAGLQSSIKPARDVLTQS